MIKDEILLTLKQQKKSEDSAGQLPPSTFVKIRGFIIQKFPQIKLQGFFTTQFEAFLLVEQLQGFVSRKLQSQISGWAKKKKF